jgi:type I restriction enzyme S subunit
MVSFFCIQPDENALQKFEAIVGPYFERIQRSIEENVKLAATRDYLLPKLLSGEISV